MFRTLRALFRPLTSIAKELAIIRQLYEADLASRPNPIYRVTEKPSKGDTEVTWSGVDREQEPAHRRWFQAAEEDE